MKTKYTPIVGIDFIDEHGIRHFNFSLCSQGPDGFRARAFVDMRDTAATRIGLSPETSSRKSAIIRLARIYQTRSIPQRFSKRA